METVRKWRPKRQEGAAKPVQVKLSCSPVLHARISAVAAAQWITVSEFVKISAASAVAKYEETVLGRPSA